MIKFVVFNKISGWTSL